MKREAAISLSIAAVSMSLLFPTITQAKNRNDLPTAPNVTNQTFAAEQAKLMVPVEVTLGDNLDARKMQPGQQFKAKLGETIHLKNGPELPRGTVLIGAIGTDPMQMDGKPTLALRFTQAKLKDGKVVPIRATILEVLQPNQGHGVASHDDAPPLLNEQMKQIVQRNALSGVDLHSNIDSSFSGVFVSTGKNTVKLRAGTEIELSIAADQGPGQPKANGPTSLN
jgi:hypothetical protein